MKVPRRAIYMRFTFCHKDLFSAILHASPNFHLQKFLFIHQLDIGALITDRLLHHLEAPGAQLSGNHLLATIATAGAFGWFRYRLVADNLHKVALIQLFQSDPKVHDHISTMWDLA
ncbi:hypothetical protein MRX96_029798 [Rhipicephalus microplus]